MKTFPAVKITPPGPKAQKIIAQDLKYASPSYIKAYELVIERGEGPWVIDVDGNRYLDMMSGIATTATGHCHPQVVAAITQAAKKFLHICGTDFYFENFSLLCEKLALAVPAMGEQKVFLTNSGAEAVEGAVKLARFATKRQSIITFRGAFHGRTLGCVALGSSKVKYRDHFGPFMPGIYQIPYCHPYHDPLGETENSSRAIDELEKQLFKTLAAPKEVAAILIEPILGEGGYVRPTKYFLQELRRICDEHGILLIFDEVQTGNGRTGFPFASQLFEVYPDIYVTAKGLASGMPLGAIVAKSAVMTWEKGSHGSTFGGNPLACAAALATMEVINPLLPSVRKVGDWAMKRLGQLKAQYPQIGDVRGAGYLIGVELINPATKAPVPKLMEYIEKQGFRKGVLFLGCGQSTIRLAPPLILGEHEWEIMLRVFEECLQECPV